MKGLAGALALVVIGLLGGLLLLEAGLRLAGFGPFDAMPDPTIGYRHVPGAHYRRIGEGGSAGRFNSAGWRDVDHALSRPPGVTRILVVGDSYVAAFQVPLDSTFHRRLERALNARAMPGRRFEVIALGEDGNSTTADYLTYKQWGSRYDPDLIAVLFIPNDQADNWKPIALDQGRPFFMESGDSLVLDASFAATPGFHKWESLRWFKLHCATWAQVHRALTVLRGRRQPPRQANGEAVDGYYRTWNFDPRLPADSIPAFRLTEKILARFARDVAADHRRLVVFAAGFAMQEDATLLAESLRGPAFDPDKTPRWLGEVGARRGFEVVPLSPAFRTASAAIHGPLWFLNPGGYGHWNSAGHAVAARAMAEYCARVLPGLDTTIAPPIATAQSPAPARTPAPARHAPARH